MRSPHDARVTLGNRFEDALVYATRTHAPQQRKGETGIPYVAHLLAVASLVLEDGGDEDEAIGALLHDTIEDRGIRAEELAERYGERVAAIVVGCSDADVEPKPAWRLRKERYIAHLAAGADPSIVRVSLADKVHNARSVLFDYRELGEELWRRFNPEADQLWYYRSLVETFRAVTRSLLVEELDRVVTELEQVAAIGALRKLATDGEGWAELRAGGESVRLEPSDVAAAETDEDFRELVRAARVRLYEELGVETGAPIGITASWRQGASS